MLENDCLNLISWDFFSSISLVQKDDHLLILMIQLKAVVKLSDMPDSSLAHVGSLFILTDHDEWRKSQSLSDRGRAIIKTFWKLEDKMLSYKTFTEYHYWVSIDMKWVTKLEHVFLEEVDDVLSKLICVSLSSLYWSFQLLPFQNGRVC